MSSLDGRAVLTGAGVGAVLIVPATVLSQLLVDDTPNDEGSPPLVFVFFALTLVGFALAGRVAGTRPGAERTPVTHGVAAAVLTYAAVQAIGAVLVIADGEELAVDSMIAAMLLAASCGAAGGLTAARSISRAIDAAAEDGGAGLGDVGASERRDGGSPT